MLKTVNRLFILLLVCSFGSLDAQDWVEGMQDHRINFYQVQQDFEDFWKGKTVERGNGFKQFKRWEAFTEERVQPTGERPHPSVWFQGVQAMKQATSSNGPLGDWRPLGPFNGNVINGIGRLNCIAFDPTDNNVFYVGAPAGGLWKTDDGGQTWITTTDDLTSLGVSAIAIDPTNSDHIYIATGDRDGADTYSHGVMESFDAGLSWQNTGLVHTIQSTVRATGLLLNTNNPLELVLTTRSGIYKTLDGGVNWTNVAGGSFQSLHQKSGNPEILFATTYPSARIWRSDDGGDSWNMLDPNTVGLPTGARRMELATTPADTNYIYCLAAASNNSFLGLWRSTDGGATWTQRSSSPNLLGWSTSGSDSGGQGWYDLAIAVAHDNRNEVYTGGVNIWKSANGGSSWNLNAHWFGGGGRPFVHADIHGLHFQPGTSNLFACSDGGLYRTSNGGSSWQELQNGMNITQYYKISTSDADSVKYLAGAQDNGTHMRINGNSFDRVLGGDGMDNAIDLQNPNTMYGSSQYGNFSKSTNGGNNFNAAFDVGNVLPMGNGAWVTPIELDPLTSTTVYIGYTRVYRSTDAGVNFSAVSSVLTGDDIQMLYVPRANTDHVYARVSNSQFLYRSTNGAQNFSLIASIPGSGTITGVAVDDADEQHVWVTRSGYSAGQKVYESFNGGGSWTNISGNLPNLPVNCILYTDTANDGVYVGTDAGVYYRNNDLADWMPYMQGLPNVIVNDLEFQPLSDKIRAGTYGRGVWESPAYNGDLLPPIAAIAPIASPCSAQNTVRLRSQSQYQVDRYKWKVRPSVTYVNGTSDTSASPQILLSQNAWHDVQLIVSNANGTDSITEFAAFRSGGLPLPYLEGFDGTDSLGNWTVDNPDQIPGLGWQQVSIVGPGGTPTKAARMDLYQYAVGGLTKRKDHLISPAIDFFTHQNISLSFDHAYARRNGNSYDTLIVSVSTDCGQSWSEVSRRVHGQGAGLATRGNVSGPFNPSTSSDWCGGGSASGCSVVDLSAYDGQAGVRIRFTTVSNRGNRLFIDNININGTARTAPIADFTSTRSSCANYDVQYLNLTTGVQDSVRWIFPGGTPATSTSPNPVVRYATPGTYNVELKAYNGLGSDNKLRNSYIQIQPNTAVQISLQQLGGLCSGAPVDLFVLENGVGSAPQYEWYLNGAALGLNDSAVTLNNLVNGDMVYATVISSEYCAWPQIASSDTIVINLNPAPVVTAVSIPAICQKDGPQLLSFGSPAGGTYSGPGVVNDTLYPSLAGSGTKIMKYTYTDANGCSASVNKSVKISSRPVFAFTARTVCTTDPAYSPNWVQPTGGDYIFQGDTVSLIDGTKLSPGNYAADYYYQNGSCDSTYSFTFDVIPGPAKPSVISSNDTLFSSLSGNAYRWYRDGLRITGAGDSSYVPNQSGYYQVEVRSTDGCGNRSDSLQFISNIGLQEVLARQFEIYPNPNQGSFRIQLPSWAQGTLRLYNAAGQSVAQGEISGGLTEYEFAFDLPSGVYLLHFSSPTHFARSRMVIE